MKIVNLGSTLRIFPDDLKVEDKIPTGTYDVDFNPMSGYSLTKHSDFETTEKVYGEHDTLADKMVNRYEHSTKNFLSKQPTVSISYMLQVLLIHYTQ